MREPELFGSAAGDPQQRFAHPADPLLDDTQSWLRQWRRRLSAEEAAAIPEDEARLVIDAVLEELRGGHPESLDSAGRAWGRAHRSVSEMVGRLSSFRECLAASGVDDPLKMHRALDRVTAAATEEVLHRLEHASRTDALTGVGNRRAFDETLQAGLSAAARQHHEVTVVAVDLDGLKRINDSQGHAAGDAALLGLVRAFYSALRDEDTIFRVGGDEFIILLPFTSVQAAELLMERVASTGAPSFTWGAAGYPADGTDGRHLVEAADQDLYRRRHRRRSPAMRGEPNVRAERSGILATMSRSTRGDEMSDPESASDAEQVQNSSLIRWAWLPAAAVLVASLVATLVAAGNGPNPTGVFSAAPKPQPATAAAGGGSSSTPIDAGASQETPTASSTVHAFGVLASQYLSPVTSGSSGGSVPQSSTGGSPSSGGSGNAGSGGGSNGGGSSSPVSTIVGVVQQVLAPVPVLGGSNGVAQKVVSATSA